MLESHALHQLHREVGMTIVLADFVNRADVGMIQSRGGPSFPPEALKCLRVSGDLLWQEFQGNVTAEVFVLGFVDHTHPAATEFL